MKKTRDRISSLLGKAGFGGGDPTTANEQFGQGGLGKGSVNQHNPHEIGGTRQKEGLLKKLQRHMVAAAYAEAGELESAQEVMSTARSLKTVLLVVEGAVPDPATFTYAVNLCKRTNSQLDILQVIEKSDAEGDYSGLSQSLAEGSHHIIGLVRKLEESKVPFKVTVRFGDINEKLRNCTKRRKDVSTVVLDSAKTRADSSDKGAWARVLENIAHQLSVPLVTVVPRNAAIAPT